MSASFYPLREIMMICQGCGGERMVPAHELAVILSAEDLKAFTSGRMDLYRCRCGGTHCDLRILPSEEGEAEIRKHSPMPKDDKEPV